MTRGGRQGPLSGTPQSDRGPPGHRAKRPLLLPGARAQWGGFSAQEAASCPAAGTAQLGARGAGVSRAEPLPECVTSRSRVSVGEAAGRGLRAWVLAGVSPHHRPRPAGPQDGHLPASPSASVWPQLPGCPREESVESGGCGKLAPAGDAHPRVCPGGPWARRAFPGALPSPSPRSVPPVPAPPRERAPAPAPIAWQPHGPAQAARAAQMPPDEGAAWGGLSCPGAGRVRMSLVRTLSTRLSGRWLLAARESELPKVDPSATRGKALLDPPFPLHVASVCDGKSHADTGEQHNESSCAHRQHRQLPSPGHTARHCVCMYSARSSET